MDMCLCRRRFRRLARSLSPVVLCLAGACDDADRGRPPAVDLPSSWPNEDGRFWVYELEGVFYSDSVAVTVYETPAAVPPAPTLDEAIQLLQAPAPRKPARTQHAQYMLRFSGTKTTESGAMGQNLEATLDGEPVAALAGAAARAPRPAGQPGEWRQGGFALQLRRARPDLWRRSTAGSAATTRDSFEIVPPPPTFLPGGAWEKGAEQIVLFSSLDLDPAWLYLEADLHIGHEFTFQLIKLLANDVFLHARMHRYVTVTTQTGTYAKALEVVYLVDFGIAEIPGGPEGAPLGYTRGFAIGAVVYAPLVGPIWDLERNLYFVGDEGPSGPLVSVLSNLQATGTSEP